MRLTNAIFARDKDKNLTTTFKECGKGVTVTEHIDDLIEPFLKGIVVKEYVKSESEEVTIEVLDVEKLPDLIKKIDILSSSLSKKFTKSKTLKNKNEIFSEFYSISNLNSLIRDYFSMVDRKTDLFIYYT
jgi:hypothetical protein